MFLVSYKRIKWCYMTKDIFIEIASIIKSDYGTDTVSTKSKGTFFEKEGLIYIFYEEENEDGSIVKSRITVADDYMELKSQGARTTRMRFTPLEITSSEYITAIGNINIRIQTFLYNIIIEENRIKISLKYRLMTDEDIFSENEMIIKIKPAL